MPSNLSQRAGAFLQWRTIRVVPNGALLGGSDNVCCGSAACCHNICDMDGHRFVGGYLAWDFPLLYG